MGVPLLDASKHNPLEHYIRRRCIANNQNFMGVFLGGVGEGKSTVKDTPVLMADGSWKMCQDIKAGDKVISLDKKGKSCFETVLETYVYFSNDIYEVKQRKRDKKSLYFCSGNHKIPLTKYFLPKVNYKTPKELRYWGVEDREAQDIFKLSDTTMNSKCMYNFSVPLIDKFDKNVKDPLIEPYTLGVILGDGHFNKALRIFSNDIEIINEITKYYVFLSISNDNRTTCKGYSFSLNSNLARQLTELGLKGKLSGDKFIPFNCKTASVKFRKRLLSGLLDTDGTISKTGAISITTKSKQLAEDIKFLVHSLGGYARIKKKIKGIKSINFKGEYYHVILYFKENIFDCKIPRKRDKLASLKFTSKNHVNKRNVSIKVSKTKRKEMLYGFMVSGDSHYFITNDFMVTHNSYSAISLAEGVDTRFTIDQVCADSNEMLNYLASKKIYKATTLVLDEAGVNFSSRKWMSKENKALGELFQTFRYMNVALMFTLPNFTFLDNQARKLVHFTFEKPFVRKEYNLCMMRGKYMSHDDFSEKFVSHFAMMRYPDGKIAKVARFAFRLASPHLLNAYEIKKKEWNKGLLDKTKRILEGKDEKKIKKLKNDDDWILKYELDGRMLKVSNEIQSNVDSYLIYKGKMKGWDFSPTIIRADFEGMKGLDATRVIRYLKKKVDVTDYIIEKNKKGVSK